MKKLLINQNDASAIALHARSAFPFEACGLVYGAIEAQCCVVSHVEAMANAEGTIPEQRFAISPADLLKAHKQARAFGRTIVGHYHSHPNGRAQPSLIDVASITDDGSIWLIQALSQTNLGALNAFKPNAGGGSFKTLDVILLDA